MLRLSQTNIMLVLFYTFTLCSLCKCGNKNIHTQLCSYQYLTNACTSKRSEITFNLKDPFLESKYIRKLALAVRLLRFLGGTTFIGLQPCFDGNWYIAPEEELGWSCLQSYPYFWFVAMAVTDPFISGLCLHAAWYLLLRWRAVRRLTCVEQPYK